MNSRKQIIAVVMIAVIAVAMVFAFAMNHRRDAAKQEEYEQHMVAEAEKKEGRDQEDEDKKSRLEMLEAAVRTAIDTYVPGVIFYGDSLTEGEGGDGTNYPSMVKTLITSNVYDIPTSIVNVVTNPTAGERFATYLPVVFLGTDSGWNGDIQELIRQQQELIKGHDRYIIIGIPTGSGPERADLEAAMEELYGDKYINLRQVFSSDGMESIDLVPTSEDLLAMAQGRAPASLFSEDGIHLNYNGYKLVAFLTFDRMLELGYFEEVSNAVRAYNNEKNTL